MSVFKDRTYRLTRNRAPLMYMLASRHKSNHPLLYFDEKKGYNRPLRYARNQRSPFEDEQDGNAILEPVVFENGLLLVPRNNPVLQEFLKYHPSNGMLFEEVDTERDAQAELDMASLRLDAQLAVREVDISLLESVARVVLGRDVTKMTTSELRRDMLVYAQSQPEAILEALSDDGIQFESRVQLLFDESVLGFRNNKRDVHYNLPDNKKRLLTIPPDENTMRYICAYLSSGDGADIFLELEKHLSS
jgi:hypothetical protein